MPPIDRGTITLTTAAIIMSCVVGLVTTVLTVWFTSVNAVERGFEKVNTRIEKLEDRMNQLESDKQKLAGTFNNGEAGLKPDEIKVKNYR